jgi:radical SAM superfamily enzyme YgiQ (UPF0313 family)
MKTLILAINAKYVHSALAPWYLKAAVLAKNTEIRQGYHDSHMLLPVPEILETNINKPIKETLSAIDAYKPDMLAISCYIWNMPIVEQILEYISISMPDCFIVLGGPEVSFNAIERLEQLPMVDCIVCGEGEAPFTQLLGIQCENQLISPSGAAGALSEVPGLAWRYDGVVVRNPSTDHSPDTDPPDPYIPEYFRRLDGRIAYLETSRGCPFSF